MKTVVFVSEKGGVGKTGVPDSLYSFDGQYKNRNTDKKVEHPDVAIVDTPGRIMDTKTTQTIEGADMVVVPVRPTGGNIEAFTRTIALVKDHANCPVMIVVNGANRFSATTSFMEWLEKFRTKEKLDAIMVIPQSEVLVQAENYRCSVNEINRTSLATQAVNALCDKISVLTGLPVEKRQTKSKKLVAK